MREYNPHFSFYKETILSYFKIKTEAATVPEHSEEGVWMKTYRYAFTTIVSINDAHYFQGHDLDSDQEELEKYHSQAVEWIKKQEGL